MEEDTRFAQYVIHQEARNQTERVYDCCQIQPTLALSILEEVCHSFIHSYYQSHLLINWSINE